MTAETPRQIRLLVVDDHAVNLNVIIAICGLSNIVIETVASGHECLTRLSEESFDIVLMDIQMPEMDGIMTTACIRELGGENGDIPVIAVTANAMKGDRERYLASGLDDYVSKPIEAELLFDTIERHVGVKVVRKTAEEAAALRASPDEEVA